MIFIGIDWSKTKHDIGYMDDSGRRISHQVIPHSQIGFQQFHEQCEKLGSGAGYMSDRHRDELQPVGR